LEILCDLLVPQRNVPSSVIDDRPELGVALKVVHQVLHAVDAVDQVDDAVLFSLREREMM
jgi:hypothetical protein